MWLDKFTSKEVAFKAATSFGVNLYIFSYNAYGRFCEIFLLLSFILRIHDGQP